MVQHNPDEHEEDAPHTDESMRHGPERPPCPDHAIYQPRLPVEVAPKGEEEILLEGAGETNEQLAAPPASPWAEEAGRQEGQEGETLQGASGIPGGRIAEQRPGISEIDEQQGTLEPPIGEEAEMPGGEVRMTEHVIEPEGKPKQRRSGVR